MQLQAQALTALRQGLARELREVQGRAAWCRTRCPASSTVFPSIVIAAPRFSGFLASVHIVWMAPCVAEAAAAAEAA